VFEYDAEHYVNAYGETLVSDKEKTYYLEEKFRQKRQRKKS